MKGFTVCGPPSSRDTPMTASPCSPYFFCRSMKPGISILQGTHQVAQKSRMTTLPLKSDSFTGSPSTPLSCHGGAAFKGGAAALSEPARDGAIARESRPMMPRSDAAAIEPNLRLVAFISSVTGEGGVLFREIGDRARWPGHRVRGWG